MSTLLVDTAMIVLSTGLLMYAIAFVYIMVSNEAWKHLRVKHKFARKILDASIRIAAMLSIISIALKLHGR
jgi:hypothetical protein